MARKQSPATVARHLRGIGAKIANQFDQFTDAETRALKTAILAVRRNEQLEELRSTKALPESEVDAVTAAIDLARAA